MTEAIRSVFISIWSDITPDKYLGIALLQIQKRRNYGMLNKGGPIQLLAIYPVVLLHINKCKFFLPDFPISNIKYLHKNKYLLADCN